MRNDFDLSWGDIIDMCHTWGVFTSLSSIVFAKVTPKDTLEDRLTKFEKKLSETTKFLSSVSNQLSQNSFLANAPDDIVKGRIDQLMELEETYEAQSHLVDMLRFANQYKLQEG